MWIQFTLFNKNNMKFIYAYLKKMHESKGAVTEDFRLVISYGSNMWTFLPMRYVCYWMAPLGGRHKEEKEQEEAALILTGMFVIAAPQWNIVK